MSDQPQMIDTYCARCRKAVDANAPDTAKLTNRDYPIEHFHAACWERYLAQVEKAGYSRRQRRGWR